MVCLFINIMNFILEKTKTYMFFSRYKGSLNF